jgi:hypothetical protein
VQADASTGASSESSDSTTTRKFHEQVEPPTTPEENESDLRRTARETVAEDLKAWQDKYSSAADEGAAEIEDRIDEIAKRMIRRQGRTIGKSLIDTLKTTTTTELTKLRADILTTVVSVQQGSITAQEANDQALAAVRRAGSEIKQKAQDIRDWHQKYGEELRAAVTEAASSHFTILSGIRDLALQKIGMKWAWMDGVTYRDWAKYHQLRERFTEWEQDLEQMVVSHPMLLEAQELGQNIEDDGMGLAQDAAKELVRLKDVAALKIAALDVSEEFDGEALAANTGKEESAADVVDGASNASPSDSTPEEFAGGISDATSSFVEGAATSEPDSTAAAESAVSSELEQPAELPTSSPDTADEMAVPPSEPNNDQASESPAPIAPAELPTEQIPIEVVNSAGTQPEEPAEPAEPSPIDLPVDDVLELDDEDGDEEVIEEEPIPTTTATSVKSAMFGAAAESVPTRKPVLDDDTYDSAAVLMASIRTELPQSISSVASSAYSAAVSNAAVKYSQALSIVSEQIKGSTLPAHQQMLSSVSAAYSDATASASSRLDDALKAAADFYGSATARVLVRPTPTAKPIVEWERVESIAAERLSQGLAWAESQYESAKVAVGLATPTPTSPTDKLLQNAKYQYYAGLGMAHARYSEFMAGASSALSSLTATPTPTDLKGTASSVASVASESAAWAASAASASAASAAAAVGDTASSAASVASENIASVASAASDSAASAASAVSEGVYAAGASASSVASVVGDTMSSAAAAGYENVGEAVGAATSVAAEQWDFLVNRLSVQIYGAPTPTAWYDSVASAAGEYASSASAAVTEAPAYAAAASDAASKRFVEVSSIVSELLIGKEPTFSESVISRLSAAYATGAASVSSMASVVSSAASEATDVVKEKAKHVKDEL